MIVFQGAPDYQRAFPASQHQLDLWQQQMQMMESFHDNMMLMVQMFVALHRQHLGTVKDELDKVRNLTWELGVLQKKLEEPLPLAQNGRGADIDSTAASGKVSCLDHRISEPTLVVGHLEFLALPGS
jgi:hypothetical protein